jgi:hypothetical protein
MSSIKIGTTHGGITLFSALGTPVKDPAKMNFYPYSSIIRMASNKAIGRGAPYATMYWKYITRAQRDQLRTFCTGASNMIHLSLPANDNSNAYVDYVGTMIWPIAENYFTGAAGDLIQDLTITFVNLVTE